MFIWLHALPHLPYCILAPMHQCMDIWMCVHGKTKKSLKRNPNLACQRQTSNQTEKQGLKNIKEGQNRGILWKRNKETDAKKLRLGFLGDRKSVV